MVDNKLLERLESIENVLKKIGDQLEAAIRGKCEHHWSTIDGRCVRCGDDPPKDIADFLDRRRAKLHGEAAVRANATVSSCQEKGALLRKLRALQTMRCDVERISRYGVPQWLNHSTHARSTK